MNYDFVDRKVERYNSFKKIYTRLVDLVNTDVSNQDDIIKKGIMDGVIQRFEFTFELMWKVLKEYMETAGFSDFVSGPKGILKFAFKNGIINDEEIFSKMLEDRNRTTHMYDEKIAEEIYLNIKERYVEEIRKVIVFLNENYNI